MNELMSLDSMNLDYRWRQLLTMFTEVIQYNRIQNCARDADVKMYIYEAPIKGARSINNILFNYFILNHRCIQLFPLWIRDVLTLSRFHSSVTNERSC